MPEVAVAEESGVELESLIEQANEMLTEVGVPEVANSAEYFQNIDYGWPRLILNFRDATTEQRMMGRRGGKSEVAEKTHRPDQTDDPTLAGESTSWNFGLRAAMQERWQRYQKLLSETTVSIKNSGDEETTKSDRIKQLLDQFRETISQEFEHSFDDYLGFLNQHSPQEIDRLNLVLAGSGADAIVMAQRLLCAADTTSATTKENGSGVMKGLELPSGAIAVRSFDSESKETNVPIDDATFAEEYSKRIANGERFLSITAATKSGLRYDNPGGGVYQVLAAVEAHNQTADENDQVVAVIDVIQLAGRVPAAAWLQFLNKPGVMGVVHTSSKGAGAIPHMGSLILSEAGKTRLADRRDSGQLDLDRLQTEFQERQVISAEAVADQVAPSQDVMAMLRAQDNCEAIMEMEELVNHPKFKEVIAQLQNFYGQRFTDHGFKVIRSDLPTLLSFEPPADLLYDKVDSVLLTTLAEHGISMGGFVHEDKNSPPILRFGLNARVLRSSLLNEGPPLDWNRTETVFNTALANAVAKTRATSQNS